MQLESVIAVVAGVAALAVILWPRVGVAARLWRAADAAERIRVEDAVKHLFTSEAAHRPSSVESLAGAVGIPVAEMHRLLVEEGDSVRRGQLLVKIRPDTWESQLQRAQASLSQQRANLAQAVDFDQRGADAAQR